MEFIEILLGSLAGAAAVEATSLAVTQAGRDMAAKFHALGTLEGRAKQDIIAVVGPPTSISNLGESLLLLHWQVTGFHIAITFSGEICQGISHLYQDQSCRVSTSKKTKKVTGPVKVNKKIAALLAFFLGIFGVHKFYFRQYFWGAIYLGFFWTYIPLFVSIMEALLYAMMSEEEFAKFVKKYCKKCTV